MTPMRSPSQNSMSFDEQNGQWMLGEYPLPPIESASDANTAQKFEDVLGIKALTLWGKSENALTVA